MRILLLILLIISLNSLSQVYNPSGFGRMKIGMSIDSLSELKCSKLVKNRYDLFKIFEECGDMPIQISSVDKIIETYPWYSHEYLCDKNHKHRYILELEADTSSYYNFIESIKIGSFDKRIRIFYMSEFHINDSLILEDVKIYFFDKKLYKIEVQKDLSEILKIKYNTFKTDSIFSKVEFVGRRNIYTSTLVLDSKLFKDSGFYSGFYDVRHSCKGDIYYEDTYREENKDNHKPKNRKGEIIGNCKFYYLLKNEENVFGKIISSKSNWYLEESLYKKTWITSNKTILYTTKFNKIKFFYNHNKNCDDFFNNYYEYTYLYDEEINNIANIELGKYHKISQNLLNKEIKEIEKKKNDLINQKNETEKKYKEMIINNF